MIANLARGLLLLDVDGPLNPCDAKPSARPDGYTTWRYTPTGGWYTGKEARRHKGLRVWLHPDHGAQLTALAEQTGLELVWATTWMHDANTCIGPAIGLPPLPVIEFRPPELTAPHRWSTSGRWKYPAVSSYAAGRPLVWLDDDHSGHDAPAWRAARDAFVVARIGLPTFLCHVNPQRGIQPHHLGLIRDWAAALKASR